LVEGLHLIASNINSKIGGLRSDVVAFVAEGHRNVSAAGSDMFAERKEMLAVEGTIGLTESNLQAEEILKTAQVRCFLHGIF
jgi:hypothetical protein